MDNQASTLQYETKKQELIRLFSEGYYHSHINDTNFYTVFQLLMHDKDPYEILKILIDDRIKITAKFHTVMEVLPRSSWELIKDKL